MNLQLKIANLRRATLDQRACKASRHRNQGSYKACSSSRVTPEQDSNKSCLPVHTPVHPCAPKASNKQAQVLSERVAQCEQLSQAQGSVFVLLIALPWY